DRIGGPEEELLIVFTAIANRRSVLVVEEAGTLRQLEVLVQLHDFATLHAAMVRLAVDDAGWALVAEVLVHAIGRDEHEVARLPVEPLGVVHLVPLAFDDI